jgi:hypothetical protein
MTESDNYDEEFRETYFALLKAVGDPDFDKMTRTELRWKVGQMMRDKKVSRMTFVVTIIEGQKLYPDKFDYVVGGLLKNVIARVDRDLNGAFPELLWLLHASGHLSNRNTMTDMFDLAQDLITIAGHKLARSYLNYLLLTSSRDEAKIIIPAYYYTRHDMESLRLIIPFVLDDDPKLTQIIYGDAGAFVDSLGENQLSQDDLDFLIEFFEKDLIHQMETTRRYSEEALKMLKKE